MSTNPRGVPVNPMTVRELEAENVRLRVELGEAESLARHNEYEAQTLSREVCEAQATIARVRELCEAHMWDLEEDERGLDTIQTIRILRALDGGHQMSDFSYDWAGLVANKDDEIDRLRAECHALDIRRSEMAARYEATLARVQAVITDHDCCNCLVRADGCEHMWNEMREVFRPAFDGSTE